VHNVGAGSLQIDSGSILDGVSHLNGGDGFVHHWHR
jgi:hypothetical protein